MGFPARRDPAASNRRQPSLSPRSAYRKLALAKQVRAAPEIEPYARDPVDLDQLTRIGKREKWQLRAETGFPPVAQIQIVEVGHCLVGVALTLRVPEDRELRALHFPR